MEDLEQKVRRLEALIGQNGDLEAKLAQARERLNLALSAGNLAWWEMDCRTGSVVFNERKALMLGFAPEQFADAHYSAFTNLLHPEDYEGAMEAMRKHLTGEKELYEVEYRIRKKSGDYVWFHDRGSITERDEEGRPVTVKGIVFDITDKKKAELALIESERKLRRANELKDKLFSIVAHDLRNSIGGLAMSLELIADQPDLYREEDRTKQLSLLKDTSISILHLLQNMLNWAQSQQGSIAFAPQNFALAPLVNSCMKATEAAARLKNVVIRMHLLEDFGVYADEEMVSIILINLLSNAIKYTEKGGTIDVEARRKDSEVEVTVIDTGTGMDEDTLSALFTPELRSRKGTRRESGSGLGLILCKEFVEKNSGRIWAESEPGKGSAFHITLPSRDG
ncbi:MAG: PAS domain-containing protein [Chitinivibrionales bacterium]|nr:PAS domain-containing protein [Chitinivibrionales bacterium]MBD3355821.1 PAS domain-containing protein [Chitinivibrionales bacterium]